MAITIGALAILGSITLATAALLTTEIDVDDLLDSLGPVQIPALLLIAITVVGSLFMSGRRWARWVLALILAGGCAWILISMEISGVWLRVALAVAVVWGLCAITLVTSRRVTRYMEGMANHWMTGYERLICPLRSDDDARRWLSMLDNWESAGVLPRGDKKRLVRALVLWLERSGSLADDVRSRIESLALVTSDHRVMALGRRVVRKRKRTD